jgi:diguanylate cyclase (GGDEF)-like protein
MKRLTAGEARLIRSDHSAARSRGRKFESLELEGKGVDHARSRIAASDCSRFALPQDRVLELPPEPAGEPRFRGVLWAYTLLGVLLGAGAPLGALGLRILSGVRDLPAELRQNAFFYQYELIGSCLVFGIAGFLAGRRAERYRSGRDRYRTLAEHDALTRLANARAFLDHHGRALEHAARYHEPLSLLLIDVDELKALNDSFGHTFGGEALRHVADVLRECKREDDLAARWGGDEFALLMRGADEAAARRQAEAILARLRAEPLRIGGVERRISVTIGIATTRGAGAETLFERADLALYAGKAAGRDRAVSDARLTAEP